VVLARLDVLKRLRFADIGADWTWLAREYPRLSRDACLAGMHVITSGGRVLAGFDAYRSLAAALPLAWVVVPLLYLPGVPQIGRRVYRAIASRRGTTTCAVPVVR
jgi:predicted DCC family thiol-disulfide oxidoreductase YuxK